MDLSTTKIVAGESPLNNEVHNFEDWVVECKKSHILPSKCTYPCSVLRRCLYCGLLLISPIHIHSLGGEAHLQLATVENTNLLLNTWKTCNLLGTLLWMNENISILGNMLQLFTKDLKLEHLPEMVFPHNVLKLQHKSGCSIEFNAKEALRQVSTSREEGFSIASAEAWRKAREETGLVEKTVGNFDWTFRSSYAGTFEGWPAPEKTSIGIDTERLKQREEILLYRDLILYEDELHDNGISLSSVRIRVMEWGFFILLRHFLRVDGVALCATDTRICHDFSTHYVTVEHTSRQGSIPELRFALSVIKEPDEVTPLLPLTNTSINKYNLPSF